MVGLPRHAARAEKEVCELINASIVKQLRVSRMYVIRNCAVARYCGKLCVGPYTIPAFSVYINLTRLLGNLMSAPTSASISG